MLRFCQIVTLTAFLGTSAGHAADLCQELFVPDGTGLTCRTVTEDGRLVTLVEDVDGDWRSLNRLRIESVDRIDEPTRWLKRRVELDLSEIGDLFDSWIADPGNPFASAWLKSGVDRVQDALENISALPRHGCETVEKPRSGVWRMHCRWDFLIMREEAVFELREQPTGFIAIDYRYANPRRGRHFEAIINGLDPL
ncbi:MAG: hypothetical protein ACFB6S_02020 [Geminicoccaceae bacterium]